MGVNWDETSRNGAFINTIFRVYWERKIDASEVVLKKKCAIG